MKMIMRPTDSNAIEMTLSITMSMKQWKELQNQLSESYPSWELSSRISDMVSQASTHFEPKEIL